MKNLLVVLTLLLAIAAALFYKQVWAIFSGMSALESMTVIVNFLLHVAVATIIGYVAMTLPAFVKPWLRTFRHSSGQARRCGQQIEARVTMPKVNKNDALAWMASQMAKSNPTPRPLQIKNRFGEGANEAHDIHLDF